MNSRPALWWSLPGPAAARAPVPVPFFRVLALGLGLLLLGLAACSGPGPAELRSADEEFLAGNFFAAQRLYEEYLEKNPQGRLRRQAWTRLLNISLDMHNDKRRAASLLEAMLLELSDRPGEDLNLRRALAGIYSDLREWDKALEAWQKLLDQRHVPKELAWEASWSMGKIYQYQGQAGAARDVLRSCAGDAPDATSRARCLYELAQVQNMLRERQAAKKTLEDLLGLPGVDPELASMAAFLLADMWEAEGNRAKARELFLSIKDSYPNPLAVKSRLDALRKPE